MPILEEQLARLGDAKYFGSFDMFSGFDYLPTSEKSQDYFNLVTLESCVTMLSPPMGCRNTPQIYQNRILEEILKPAGIYSQPGAGCLQWIDDTPLYANDFDGYFDVLDRFLKAVQAKSLRLNVEKCHFMALEIGRVVTHRRWRFHQKYFHKILNLPARTGASCLCCGMVSSDKLRIRSVA